MSRKNQIYVGLCVLIVLSILVLYQGTEAAQTWGLCIGISDYQNDNIPDLKWASKDAIEFCTTFLKHRLRLPEEHYQILFESDANKEEIKKSLGWLNLNAEAGDRVYIFYSGCGGKASPIVPYDANPNDKQTFLGSDIIQKALNRNAGEIIFILDASYSGRLAKEASKEPNRKGLTGGWNKNLITKMAQTEEETQKEDPIDATRVIMTSSDEKQKSIELPDKKNSLFTYYLMKTLLEHPEEADTNNDGYLTLDEVYQDVYKAVTEKTLEGADFMITESTLTQLASKGVSYDIVAKLKRYLLNERIQGRKKFLQTLEAMSISKENQSLIVKYAAKSGQEPQISNEKNAEDIIILIIPRDEVTLPERTPEAFFAIRQVSIEDVEGTPLPSEDSGIYPIKKNNTTTRQPLKMNIVWPTEELL